MSNSKHLELYKEFRKELDDYCIPLILSDRQISVYDIRDGKDVVGIFCVYECFPGGNYFDCIYVLPKYRKKGLAKKVVLAWGEKNDLVGTTLHIINNNEPAKAFWNSLFELEEVSSTLVDTLYRITSVKEE